MKLLAPVQYVFFVANSSVLTNWKVVLLGPTDCAMDYINIVAEMEMKLVEKVDLLGSGGLLLLLVGDGMAHLCECRVRCCNVVE